MLSFTQFLNKNIENLIFCSFWQDLGFGECFLFFQIFNQKVLKNSFFSVWQDLGFGESLSIQILIKK